MMTHTAAANREQREMGIQPSEAGRHWRSVDAIHSIAFGLTQSDLPVDVANRIADRVALAALKFIENQVVFEASYERAAKARRR